MSVPESNDRVDQEEVADGDKDKLGDYASWSACMNIECDSPKRPCRL
jgi:hypothetical protein